MVAAYSTQGDNTVAGAAITALSLTANSGTPRRAELIEFQYGFSGTLENSTCYLRISRCTSAGTGTGGTEAPLDPADAAASTDATRNHSGEPAGLTPDLFDMPLNTQAKDRWVAIPGFGLIIPATASNGVAFTVRRDSVSTFAGECEVLAIWQE